MIVPDNYILILSSFVFLSNVFVATYKKDVIYVILFSVLLITSVMVHTMYDSKLVGTLNLYSGLERDIHLSGQKAALPPVGDRRSQPCCPVRAAEDEFGLMPRIEVKDSSFFEENMNILDKIAIYGIVGYGAYNIYSKYRKYNFFAFLYLLLIVFTFLFCIYVYYYGYTQHKYCFDPNKNTSYIYHAIMHVVSSFGHNMIMLLL